MTALINQQVAYDESADSITIYIRNTFLTKTHTKPILNHNTKPNTQTPI